MKAILLPKEERSFRVTVIIAFVAGKILKLSFSNSITPLLARALLFEISDFEPRSWPGAKSTLAEACCSSL